MRLLSMSLTFSCVNSAFLHRWRRGSSAECDGKGWSRVDELRDFFLAEDRRQAMILFRIGSLGDAPGFLESLDVEESQSRQRCVTVPDDNFRFLNSSA